ncbi:helix-turn-helix transcriptional regulator [Macrococcus brunensis]|uniref:helix-turn-helix transcriptional regulator n=1 Tax=Macrococcus brunensis TaxID=198483 RepID=UPI003B84B1B9
MLAHEGYSCISFAEKLGCHKSYVSLMQNGKRQPSHQLARKMMKLLDCNWDELFEEVQG